MSNDFDPSIKPIDSRPTFPPFVKIAGIIWIVLGSLTLLISAVLFFFFVLMPLSGRGDTAPSHGGGLFGCMITGAAFLYVGVKSARGKARDTFVSGIGSIIFGLMFGLPALFSLASGQFLAFGINGLVGAVFLAAGILALRARGQYKSWRKASRKQMTPPTGDITPPLQGEQGSPLLAQQVREDLSCRGNPSAKTVFTDISEVPWYRREDTATVSILFGFLLFPPAVWATCLICLTGNIYKERTNKDGTLRTWSFGNKLAAVIVLFVSFAYTAIMVGQLGGFAVIGTQKPSIARDYYQQGLAHAKKGNLDEALVAYSKAIELNPHFAEAYSERGYVRLKKGDRNGAIEDFSKSININPNRAIAYVDRANARYPKGELDGAIEDASKAIGLQPNYPPAYLSRGLARLRNGDAAGAIVDFSKAIELHPSYVDAYASLGLAKTQTGDLDGAMMDLNRAIELNPKYAPAYFNRGLTHLYQFKDAEAQKDFDQCLELRPDLKPQVEQVLREGKRERGNKP